MKPEIAEIKIKDEQGVEYLELDILITDIQMELDTFDIQSIGGEYFSRPSARHFCLNGRVMENYQPKGRTLNRKALIV